MRCTAARRRFDRLLDGQLDPTEAARVREHASRCAACRVELAQRRALDRLLGDALAPVPSPADLAPAVLARVAAVRNAGPNPANEAGPDLPLDVALVRSAAALLAWTATALGAAWAWLSVESGGPDQAARRAGDAIRAGTARLADTAVQVSAGDLTSVLQEALRAWVTGPGSILGRALDGLAGPLTWAAAHPSTVAAAGLTALVIGMAGLWRIHLAARQS